MIHTEPYRTLNVGCALGESILWNHYHGEAQWTDIEGRRFFRCALDGEPMSLELPERLCAFGLSRSAQWVIAAFESGFGWLNIETAEVEWLERPELGPTGRRLNDGCVDRLGRFWCGAMVEDWNAPPSEMAFLYRLEIDGAVTQLDHQFRAFNACCWAPDGKSMYFADSAYGKLWRSELSAENGDIGARKEIAHFDPASGIGPDGADVDADGYIWNAIWGGAKVIRYSPDGAADFVLDVPTALPTCVAFGGPARNLLFVTSAKQGLEDDGSASFAAAGHVFIYKTDVAGLAAEVYQGDPPSA